MKTRLDKYLTHCGVGTRSQVKLLIKNGKVTVDGEITKKSETKIDENNIVTCNGEIMHYNEFEYFMLNKPKGVVSATKDNVSTTVIELIKDCTHKDIFPVGRLDKDTEGLLIITDDGGLAHNLLSPKKHVDKKYFCRLDYELSRQSAKKLECGVEIEDGVITKPAIVEFTSIPTEVFITIHEGKFHQVKRMFNAVGLNVTYLKRMSMGNLILDKDLLPGEYRPLTTEELELLRKS